MGWCRQIFLLFAINFRADSSGGGKDDGAAVLQIELLSALLRFGPAGIDRKLLVLSYLAERFFLRSLLGKTFSFEFFGMTELFFVYTLVFCCKTFLRFCFEKLAAL